MKSYLVQGLLFVLFLIGVNWFSTDFFARIDVTEDRRFSLSEATKNMLQNLDNELLVQVYLAGDMPAGFKRLQKAVQESLEEFQVHTNVQLRFRFINPDDFDTEKRKKFYDDMLQKGMIPTNVIDNSDGKRTEKPIFPWAMLTYGNKQTKAILLKGNLMATAQERLNQSYENVEYQLATAIRELVISEKKKIGLLNTYSKVPAGRLADLVVSLQKFYEVYQVDLRTSPSLAGLDAVLLIKPDLPFSDDDKFKLDQFVMNGGKALLFVDALKIDSLGRESTFAQPNQLNLDDLFFKYGVRLNYNLVKDLELCAAIPLNVGKTGDKSQIAMVPWLFFPLLNNFGSSAITRNIEAVYSHFTGNIDTVKASGISKTPLLMTSKYTQLKNAPALVSYNEARQQPNPAKYNAGVQTVAYLLEGTFSSLFANRILPTDPKFKIFKAHSEENKMIICADGDIPTNDFDFKRGVPMPLGFDKFSRQTFGNKDFVLNAIDFLINPSGIITARNKSVELRPLDKQQLAEHRIFWQIINFAVPLGLLAILGGLWAWFRKRKFAY